MGKKVERKEVKGREGLCNGYEPLLLTPQICSKGRSRSVNTTEKKNGRIEREHTTSGTYRHVVQAEVFVVVPRTSIWLSGQARVRFRAVEKNEKRKELGREKDRGRQYFASD